MGMEWLMRWHHTMTSCSDSRTIRLVCLTTSLPEAVTQGRIPLREARSVAHIPAGAEAFSFPHLHTPLRFTHIILAEDCVGTGLFHDASCRERRAAQDGDGTGSTGFSSLPSMDSGADPAILHAALPVTRIAALKDRDYGLWHGQALRDLPSNALSALLQDMDFAPPEGESLRQFQTRVGAWLTFLTHPEPGAVQSMVEEAPSSQATTLLLMARPVVVRALATHVLQGGPDMATRLDIAPQTTSLFTHHAGRWRVRMLGVP